MVQRQTADYQNVDLPATLFSLAALATSVVFQERPSLFYRAVLPGVLGGMAVASKYNSGIVLVSVGVVIIASTPSERKWHALALLAASSALAFLVCVPYSLLDFGTFKADVLFEIHHYKNECLYSSDLWTAQSSIQSGHGQEVSRRALEKVTSQLQHGCVVLPEYGVQNIFPTKIRRNKELRRKHTEKMKRLATDANAKNRAILTSLGAKKLFSIDGKPVVLSDSRRRALPTNNPSLALFVW